MRGKIFASLPNPKLTVVIAPTLIILGLAYLFGSTYQLCSFHRELREQLRAGIESAASRSSPMRLAEIADFQWDSATILVNYKPDARTTDCPFGWDWSEAERAAGLIS